MRRTRRWYISMLLRGVPPEQINHIAARWPERTALHQRRFRMLFVRRHGQHMKARVSSREIFSLYRRIKALTSTAE